jgi:TonB family protein
MSVTVSMALHVGGLFCFWQAARIAAKAPEIKIDNVDLYIQKKKMAPIPVVPHAAAPKPTSMMDLMKMTLPAIPRAAAPRPVDIKLPDIKHPLMPQTPKLESRTMQQLAKLDTLDLNKRRVDVARIDSKLEDNHQVKALADLPRLEDVGRRQVHNLPQALKLEEQRQEAVAFKNIQGMEVSSSHRGVAPATVLQEATPQQSSALSRLSSFLPTASEPLGLQPRAAPPPPMIKHLEITPPAPSKRTAAVQEVKKKAVSIEGPLADRKVVSYDVPKFPDWAKQRNIEEAEVVIYFNVDPDGNVLSDMRVENTSGYGQLDRLSMDCLRNWKFAPITTSERQWGRITFRFILE